MNKRDYIFLGVAVAGVAVSIYYARKASALQTAQQTTLSQLAVQQNAQNSIEKWFTQLWGSVSTGGTPEATTA